MIENTQTVPEKPEGVQQQEPPHQETQVAEAVTDAPEVTPFAQGWLRTVEATQPKPPEKRPNFRKRAFEVLAAVVLTPTIALGATACSSQNADIDAATSRLAEICDPGSELRENTLAVGTFLDDIGRVRSSTADPEDVRELKNQVPSLPTAIQETGTVLIDLVQAKDIERAEDIEEVLAIESFLTTDEGRAAAEPLANAKIADLMVSEAEDSGKLPIGFTTRLNAITSDAVRDAARLQVYAALAEGFADSILSYDTIEEHSLDLEVLRQAIGTDDPQVFQLAEQYLNALGGQYSVYNSTRAQLTRLYLDRERTLRSVQGGDVSSLATDIQLDVISIVDTERVSMKSDVVEANTLDHPIAPVSELDVHVQDNRTLDVSKVTGENICLPEWGDDSRFARRFIEIRVTDGQLVTNFTDGSMDQLLPADVEAMRGAIERIRPLLESGYVSGKVLETHIMIDAREDSFQGYFIGQTDELYVLLPSSGEVSVEQFQETLVHELMHAISSDDLINGSVYTEDYPLTVQFEAAADAGRVSDIAAGLDAIRSHPEALDAITSTPSSYRRIFETVQSTLNGSSADPNTISTQSITRSTIDAVATNSISNVGSLIYGVGHLLNMTDEAIQNAVDDYTRDLQGEGIANDEPLLEISGAWFDVAGGDASTISSFNEAFYVETDDMSKPFLGHSADNNRELFASAMNVLINYPDKLAESLWHMSDERRVVALNIVRTALEVFKKNMPEFTAYADNAYATLVAKANG